MSQAVAVAAAQEATHPIDMHPYAADILYIYFI